MMSEKTKESQRRLSCLVVALRKVSLAWLPSGDCLCVCVRGCGNNNIGDEHYCCVVLCLVLSCPVSLPKT